MAKASARNKMMDFLAQRDHSELELRKKLKKSGFTDEEIDPAIDYGKKQNWIPHDKNSNIALSNRAAGSLHKKKKGILYINHFLSEKGLPEVECDPIVELEKAKKLIENKFSAQIQKCPKDFEDRRKLEGKIARFLASRGFESDIINRLIKRDVYEKLFSN